MGIPSYYVPLLRWRAGEYRALKRLSTPCRERTLPLIEVLPPDYDFALLRPMKHIDEQLRPLAKQLENHWPGRPALIDSGQITPETRMGDGRHPLTFIFEEARAKGLNLIPVTGIGRDIEHQLSVRGIVAADGRGLGLRCGIEEALDPDFDVNVRALLTQLDTSPDLVDVLLDLGSPEFDPQDSLIAIIVSVLEGSNVFAAARSVTILATSFPNSLTSLNYGLDFLPRREWMLYKALLVALPPQARCPGFGDYAVAAIDFPKGDMRFMRGSPNIRYAIDDGWLVAKAKRQKSNNNHAYPGLCGAIIGSGRFAGAAFSEGSKYIQGCRIGIEKMGNPTTWKWVATNHHITKVVEDLAKLSET